MLDRIFVDRPGARATSAVVAAWCGFMVGLFAGGDIQDAGSFVVAALIGTVLVVAGFAAASRCRTLRQAERPALARLVLMSLLIGAAAGAANLAANALIAASSPTLRALLTERVTTIPPLIGLVSAPLVEETAVRLFFMSVLAWMVSCLTGRQSAILGVALVGSSLVFALLHLTRPMPADASLANYYRAALLIKYTLGGLPLGWVFWRWGLPFAILCHAAVNGIHLLLQRLLF